MEYDGKTEILVDAASGVGLIARERARQIEAEEFTAEHDAQHVQKELAAAAVSYLLDYLGRVTAAAYHWPKTWSLKWFKPTEDKVRQLTKAGALIAAEIDRLQEIEDKAKGKGHVV